MSARVHVVDYGVGNLYSLINALREIGCDALLTPDPDAVTTADRLILPGVGAFASTYATFRARGMEDAVRRYLDRQRPMLGICVGMQMLMTQSEEFGITQGLDIIPGTVSRIADQSPEGIPHKIPHIGWTDVVPAEGGSEWKSPVFNGIAPGTPFYFVHSYSAQPSEPDFRLADGFYNGVRITASVTRGHVTGTQFHPEKSGRAGLQLLHNFAKL